MRSTAYLINSQLFTREFANSVLLDKKSSLALYYEQQDDERFNVLFNSVSVISGRREGENERLNALEHRLRLGAPVAQWVKRWPLI